MKSVTGLLQSCLLFLFLSSISIFVDPVLGATKSSCHSLLSVNAFERLMENWVKKSANPPQSKHILKLISVSEGPINPFQGSVDIFGIQMSHAIEKLLPQLKYNWDDVRRISQDMLERLLRVQSLQKEMESATDAIIVAKPTQHFKMDTEVGLHGRWLNGKNRTFYVYGSYLKQLTLYELGNTTGQLTQLSQYPQGDYSLWILSWKTEDGRIYVAALGGRNLTSSYEELDPTHLDLYIYELDESAGQLIFKHQHKVDRDLRGVASWVVIQDKAYIVAANTNQHMYMYEIDLHSGKLLNRSRHKIWSTLNSMPAWQQWGDRYFVVMLNESERLMVFELALSSSSKKSKLSMVDYLDLDIGAPQYLNPYPIEWNLSDQRLYLAVGSSVVNLYLYELLPPKQDRGLLETLKPYFTFQTKSRPLQLRQTHPTSGDGAMYPSWHQVGQRRFLASGSIDNNLYLYELNSVTGLLEEVQRINMESGIYSNSAWISDQGRELLAVHASREGLQLFEFDVVARKATLLWTYADQTGLQGSPQFVKTATGDIYLVIATQNGHLRIFSVFHKVARQ